MAIQEQNLNFEAFAKCLAEQSGEEISLQDALEMWESIDEDAMAIQAAINSYEAGERGRPADEAMAELRAKLKQKHGV